MVKSTVPDLTLSPTEDQDVPDNSILWAGDGLLHFHGLHSAQVIAGLYGVAGLDVDGDDGAGMRALISIISSSLNQISLCIVFTPCLWW